MTLLLCLCPKGGWFRTIATLAWMNIVVRAYSEMEQFAGFCKFHFFSRRSERGTMVTMPGRNPFLAMRTADFMPSTASQFRNLIEVQNETAG